MPPTAKAEFERLSMKHPEHFMVTISPRFRIRIICEKTTLLFCHFFNSIIYLLSSYLFDLWVFERVQFLNSSVKSLSSQHPQMETGPANLFESSHISNHSPGFSAGVHACQTPCDHHRLVPRKIEFLPTQTQKALGPLGEWL